VHVDRVEVALVDRAGDRDLGAQAHGHAVQALAVQVGDRRLPRHEDLERQRQLLPFAQDQPAGDTRPVELGGRVVLRVAAFDLDAGDQRQRDLGDLDVVASGGEVDLSGQRQAWAGARVG
jgi:hypothetical protein